MPKKILIPIIFGFLFSCSGCASIWHAASSRPQGAEFQPLPAYNGPKASVVVADFQVASIKADTAVAAGLRQMLLAALERSNRFVPEHNFTAAGLSQKDSLSTGTGETKKKAKPADLIIASSVIDFEPRASGGRSGIGGGGGSGSGRLGGLEGTSASKAQLILNIRIIDAATSQVIGETRLKGQALEGVAAKKSSGWDSYLLSKELYLYSNTPMEKAIRICINEAARYISQTVPEKYYTY